VWDVDLFRECGCGCLTCPHGSAEELAPQASFENYARTRKGVATLDGLGLNRRLPEQLKAWVRALDDRPRFVTLGHTTEPLPGFAEAEEVLERCLRVLLPANIGVSLQTRRLVPSQILDILGEHASLTQVTVPLPTLSDAELKIWEPGTALANQRLWNVQQLRLRRVPVTVSIGPLVPFVNDDSAHLGPLVRALADAGVKQLTAEFMRLSDTVRERLERRSPVSTRLIFGAYEQRELDDRLDPRRPNLSRRRAVYRLIAKLAARRRVRFSLCRCADLVLGRQICQLWPADSSPTATAPTRQERSRSRHRPPQAGAQVGFSDFFNSKR